MTVDSTAVQRLALDRLREHPEWRRGQALFNALYELHPHAADRLRATPADPFYDDQRIPAFWRTLTEDPATG